MGVRPTRRRPRSPTRLIGKLRQGHPHLKFIVTKDSLSSNAPHIETLQAYDLHYILGGKEGDHAYLFHQVQAAEQAGRVTGLVHHLSVVFATVMILALLVDQTEQRCCALFQAVWAKLGSKRLLWNT
jgi:hypothetical protein